MISFHIEDYQLGTPVSTIYLSIHIQYMTHVGNEMDIPKHLLEGEAKKQILAFVQKWTSLRAVERRSLSNMVISSVAEARRQLESSKKLTPSVRSHLCCFDKPANFVFVEYNSLSSKNETKAYQPCRKHRGS